MNFLEQSDFDWMDLLNFTERPFRAKLNPSKLWRDLDEYENDSVGLSNYFKKWRTKVEFRDPPRKNATKYVYVGGEYSPEDRQCAIQIYSLNFDKHEFSQTTWDKFKYRVIQTLMHEMIHFMQYDRRNDEYSNYVLPHKKIGHSLKDAERRYLSEFDEIQAYAHCIYLDFKMKRPNIPLEVLLARIKKYNDSSTLRYILKTFDYDFKNNYAIPKLIQHIVKWDRKYDRINSSYCN